MVILGGYNDRAGWLDEVERYDPVSKTWEVMTEWTLPRKLFNFCALPMDDTHIIIAGMISTKFIMFKEIENDEVGRAKGETVR